MQNLASLFSLFLPAKTGLRIRRFSRGFSALILSIAAVFFGAFSVRGEEPGPAEPPTLNVIIGLGQSLMVGSQSASSLVSTEPVWPDLALMFDAGPNSDVRLGLVTSGSAQETTILDPDSLTGFLPLVARRGQGSGNRGETPLEALANRLTVRADELGADFRSLSFTGAFGGSAYSSLRKGTQVYENMRVALAKAVELANAEGWQVVVAGCVLKHGEGDLRNTNYLNNLLEWRDDIDADVKAITGQTSDVHFIMAQPSTHQGTSEPQSSLAMLEAHNTSPFHHLAGADYPFGAEYASDELHMTGPGYFLIGEQMARAWEQALWSEDGKSKITQITEAKREGAVVKLTYEVPSPPLVLDTETVPERDTKGFRFSDSTGEIPIVSAEITDDGTGTGIGEITLELAYTPTGHNQTVLYALSSQSGPRTRENRVRGNVRDSAPEISAYDGRPLYNWGVVQRAPVEQPDEPLLDLLAEAPFLAGATVRGLAVNETSHPLGYIPQGDSLRDNIGSAGNPDTMRHHNPILVFELPPVLPEGGEQWQLRFRKKGGSGSQDNVDLYGLDPRMDGFVLSEVLWYQGADQDSRPFATRISAPAMLSGDVADTVYAVNVTAFVETFYDGNNRLPGADHVYFRLNPAAEVAPSSLRRQEIYNTVGHESAPVLELLGERPPIPPMVPVLEATTVAGAMVRGGSQNPSLHPIGYHPTGAAADVNAIGTTGNSGSRRHNNPVLIFDLPEELPENGAVWQLVFHRQSAGNPRAVDLYGLDSRAAGFELDEVLFYEGSDVDSRDFAKLISRSVMGLQDEPGTQYAVDVTEFLESFYEQNQLKPGLENGRIYFRLNVSGILGTDGPHRQNIYNQPGHELGPVLRLMKFVEEETGYDSWAAFFGLDPETDGAPDADPDGDGFSNAQEFAFGTDPVAGNGSLTETRNEGGSLTITFLVRETGVTYEVETNADLSETPGWIPAPEIPIAPGPADPEPPAGYDRRQFSVDFSGPEPRSFYRLRALFPD